MILRRIRREINAGVSKIAVSSGETALLLMMIPTSLRNLQKALDFKLAARRCSILRQDLSHLVNTSANCAVDKTMISEHP